MNLHRDLNQKVTKEFRQWARDNFDITMEIDPIWHPVVKEECGIIRKEAWDANVHLYHLRLGHLPTD